jgi:hypothetical protein
MNASRFWLLDVLELERAADLEELEVRSDRDLARSRRADARFHRRAEALDVELHARAARDAVGLGLGLVARVAEGHAHRAHGARGGLVEPDEAHAELAALRLLAAPEDLALDDDLVAHAVEAAHELLALRRQVRGAQPHAVGRDVDRLGLEAAAGPLADRNERLVRDAATARATLLLASLDAAGVLCASNTHSHLLPTERGSGASRPKPSASTC